MYLTWDQKTITDFSDTDINSLYNKGYLFTRLGKGVIYQTRSVRVDLSKFKLSSENKRILKKTEEIKMETMPLPYAEYDWTIGKMGKDFYEKKFGEKTFTANKLKELMANGNKSNFNLLLKYNDIGYTICHETNELLHYCYPFYDLVKAPKDVGLGMMTRAILWAKENGKKYVYLGSFSRPTDTYKLQFEGTEWYDGEKWNIDLEKIKI